MKKFTYNDLLENKIRNKIVLAIGNFEALHKGHIYILEKLKENAKKGIKTCILTFENSPKQFLNNNFEKRILSIEQRDLFFKKIKIHYVISIKFNEKIRNITAKKFLEILKQHLNIEKLFVGENFRFGKDKKGNIKILKKFAKENNINIKVIPLKKYRNKIISSSLIKQMIKKGKVYELINFLGRMYCIEGEKTKGRQIGSKLLYPTINIKEFKELPVKEGIYCGLCRIKNKDYLAVACYGSAPTLGDDEKRLEIHLINKKINIIDRTKVKFYFFKRLRNNKKFKNIILLKEQIKKDINNTLKLEKKILKLRKQEKYII